MDAMMVASFVIAPIAGTLLALRFKVFTIIPAALLAAALVVASSHQPMLTITLTVQKPWCFFRSDIWLALSLARFCKDRQWRAPSIPS